MRRLVMLTLVILLSGCSGSAKTPSSSSAGRSPVPPSTPAGSQASPTAKAGTARGVAALATAAKLSGYSVDGQVDRSLASLPWEFCNKAWAEDSARVAQSQTFLMSPSVPVQVVETEVAYDSPGSAAAALAEFEAAGRGCTKWSGTRLEAATQATVAQPPTSQLASTAKVLGQLDGQFLIGQQIVQEGHPGYEVDIFLQRGPYLVTCAGLGGDGNTAAKEAGRCAERAAEGLLHT